MPALGSDVWPLCTPGRSGLPSSARAGPHWRPASPGAGASRCVEASRGPGSSCPEGRWSTPEAAWTPPLAFEPLGLRERLSWLDNEDALGGCGGVEAHGVAHLFCCHADFQGPGRWQEMALGTLGSQSSALAVSSPCLRFPIG